MTRSRKLSHWRLERKPVGWSSRKDRKGKGKRYVQRQIIYALKRLAAGAKGREMCREPGLSEATLFVWKKKYGAMGGRPVDVAGDALNRHRTVLGRVDRQNLPARFRSFDFAVPDQCVARRPKTTVPQQKLFGQGRFTL